MAFETHDTIAAISTAVSESGIGIIRISGDDAIAAADLIFRSPGGKKKLCGVPSHTIHYGNIVDEKGRTIDEVLVSVMRAPRTYTAEDTVEINCHGGILVMKKVLDAVLHCERYAADRDQAVIDDLPVSGTDAGSENDIYAAERNAGEGFISHPVHVRAADPGEFTKRAFLNGRIDLSRAEAVMDLIEAKNEYALRNSVNQLKGALYAKISEIRSGIIYQIAHIEASLDDPEHLDFEPHIPELAQFVEKWEKEIGHLISTADDGRLAAEGIRTAIIGKPNAGKSSLLNLLVGEDRAIVTDIAGTTRDLLTETIHLQGITLLVTDTAGIRDTSDRVEQIGVERAKKCVEDADLLLWIVDSSVALDENDAQIASLLPGRRAVILLNKTDLHTVTETADIQKLLSQCAENPDGRKLVVQSAEMCDGGKLDMQNTEMCDGGKPAMQYAGTCEDDFPDPVKEMDAGDEYGDQFIPVIPFSAAQKTGYDVLVKVLTGLFFDGKLTWNDEVVITSVRHRELLERALGSLKMVAESIRQGMSEDFFSIDLMSAYESLGNILGQEVGEDLVNEIFSRFCMGK